MTSRAALLVAVLVTASPLHAAREFHLSLLTGVTHTDSVLNVEDGARFAVALDATMQVVGRLGYFLHFSLTPSPVARPLIDPLGERRVLLAHFAAGPQLELLRHPLTVGYRIGYGAVGDERFARDLLLHGLCLERRLRSSLILSLDLHHLLAGPGGGRTFGLAVGAGMAF